MSKELLVGYNDADKARIKVLASEFIAGQIERGEIPNTEAGIKNALPKAVQDARQVVSAVSEFLCG